jgi:hypothetical protein
VGGHGFAAAENSGMGNDVELIIGDLSIADSLRALPYGLLKCPARSRCSPGITAFPGHRKHETQAVKPTAN